MPLRATKIVATLGPASSDPALLEAMIRAGVNVVRLNFSHGKAEDHIERARLVREAAQRAGREVGIMADLQGPKIRVGKFAEGKVMLQAGQPFVLDASRTEPGDDNGVGLDYKELPRDVRPGDTLLLNDGLIVMKVEKVVGPAVHTSVTMGGELSNNKGINKQGGGLTAPALTAKDMDDIKTAMGLKADYVAVSFPKNATDMELARQLCNVAGASTGHKPGLIAKIERAEAIPELASILKVSDGIMVARGDLAVEVGNAAVPALQKHMIRLAREMDKVVITATQMMESMIVNPVPTRAEVSDVANAVLDGTDAVMLSAETAAGRYPLETVMEMANICSEAEKADYLELSAMQGLGDSALFDPTWIAPPARLLNVYREVPWFHYNRVLLERDSVRTPYRRQDTLPNFDAFGKDFNLSSIYTANAFSGIDRVSDSHQTHSASDSMVSPPKKGRRGRGGRIRHWGRG
mgnify:CR=1 FL=1